MSRFTWRTLRGLFQNYKKYFCCGLVSRSKQGLEIHKYSWTWRIPVFLKTTLLLFNIIVQEMSLPIWLYILHKENFNIFSSFLLGVGGQIIRKLFSASCEHHPIWKARRMKKIWMNVPFIVLFFVTTKSIGKICCLKVSMAVPKVVKHGVTRWPSNKYHFWVFTQVNWKKRLEQILVQPCS